MAAKTSDIATTNPTSAAMETVGLPIDRPITNSDEDLLGWASVAEQYRKHILDCDSSDGLVVGLFGTWGSGKTSLLNLMFPEGLGGEKPKAADPLVVMRFNPWLYASEDDLVRRFLVELAENLPKTGKALIENLKRYARVLSPALRFIPVVGDAASDATDRALDAHRDQSAHGMYRALRAMLARRKQRIVVIIDDIDRLSSAEVRDVVKLVRLTASFPNVVYVLACDRERTDTVLTDSGALKQSYLEKIVQLEFFVPAIPTNNIRKLIDMTACELFGKQAESTRFHSVQDGVILPAVESIRNIKRLQIATKPVFDAIGKEVDAVDLFALEAMRVLKPQVFTWVKTHRNELTKLEFEPRIQKRLTDSVARAGDPEREIRRVFEKAFPEDGRIVQNLIRYVFPESPDPRDMRDRRLSQRNYLSLYLDLTPSDALRAIRKAEEAVRCLPDAARFDAKLRENNPDELWSVMTALHGLLVDVPGAFIKPCAVSLVNLVARVQPPDVRRNSVDSSRAAWPLIRRIVRRLMETIPETERAAVVRGILDDSETYSSKLWLLNDDGLLGVNAEAAVAQMRTKMAEAFLKAASVSSLDPEWDILSCYAFADEWLGTVSPLNRELNLTEIRGLFRSSEPEMNAAVSASMSDPRQDREGWSLLRRVFGSSAAIRKAIEKLRADEGDSSLVLLTEMYRDFYVIPREEEDENT